MIKFIKTDWKPSVYNWYILKIKIFKQWFINHQSINKMLIKHSSFFNNVKLKYMTTGRMLYCVSYDSVLQCRTPHKPERTPQMLAVWAPQHWLYTFLPGHNLGKPSCWVYLVVASICWCQNQTLQRLDKATFLVVHLFEFMKMKFIWKTFGVF